MYSIPLLNDLHNHFPDILYRPERFRNVQDLLGYIQNVARMNPYDRGLQMYNQRPQNQWEITDNIFVVNRRSILTRFLNEYLFDDLENVPVIPTVEQVTNATNVYHVNGLQDDICTICQDNIESGEVRRITHCMHYFHKTCIDTWFQTHVVCPTCRHDIR